MIWWGYAGFSGAIVLSMALLATIMGVSTENVLALIAQSSVVLLTLGIVVNLCVIALQARPWLRSSRPTAAVVLRQPVVVVQATAPAKNPLAAKFAPVPAPAAKPVPKPMSVPKPVPRHKHIATLWPTQAAQ
jgi:hypothetical protein